MEQIILAIESSCDETAAAVMKDGVLLSNEISSQIEIHRRFGGVVPEIASRNHLMAVIPIVDSALKKANVELSQVTHVAVTYGAGLIGALLVGVSAAKAIAYALGVPLIAVNHIEAHIAANYIENSELKPPFLAVVASGGHTGIVRVKDYNDYKIIGSTTDDAIGEAFDKVARVLGLDYPGGPAIDKLSKSGAANIEFMTVKKRKDYNLSYSGLKTSVINYLHNARQKGREVNIADVCASFQNAAVSMLCDSAERAAVDNGCPIVALAGGVAANSCLRRQIAERGERSGFKTVYPSPILCTDNAAMVAMRARLSIAQNTNIADLRLNGIGNLRLERE